MYRVCVLFIGAEHVEKLIDTLRAGLLICDGFAWAGEYIGNYIAKRRDCKLTAPALQSKPQRTKPFHVPQFQALTHDPCLREHKNLKSRWPRPSDSTSVMASMHIPRACTRTMVRTRRSSRTCTPRAAPPSRSTEACGIDHVALLDTYIKAYNDCVKGRPTNMNAGLHLYRGNFRLEYDTPHAGTFKLLKHLPAHKAIMLGLISTKFPRLEVVDDLVQRVHNAAAIVA
ncbi:hypothetical protein OH77DRAFT_1440628, partial [Trametes cingulata]